MDKICVLSELLFYVEMHLLKDLVSGLESVRIVDLENFLFGQINLVIVKSVEKLVT